MVVHVEGAIAWGINGERLACAEVGDGDDYAAGATAPQERNVQKSHLLPRLPMEAAGVQECG